MMYAVRPTQSLSVSVSVSVSTVLRSSEKRSEWVSGVGQKGKEIKINNISWRNPFAKIGQPLSLPVAYIRITTLLLYVFSILTFDTTPLKA